MTAVKFVLSSAIGRWKLYLIRKEEERQVRMHRELYDDWDIVIQSCKKY